MIRCIQHKLKKRFEQQNKAFRNKDEYMQKEQKTKNYKWNMTKEQKNIACPHLHIIKDKINNMNFKKIKYNSNDNKKLQRHGHKKKIVWVTKRENLWEQVVWHNVNKIHTMQQHRNEEASLEVLEQKLHIMQMEKQEAQKVQ